jgi:hypothetical protein
MNCKEGAIHLIDEIVEIISNIQEEDYCRPLDIYNGSTLGKHFRHIYDFFHCLVHQCNLKDVDYCDRNRDGRIENERLYSISQFNQISTSIGKLEEEKEITVHADFETAPGVRPVVKTTIGREIMYGYDHAIHHLAIVKIGLRFLYPDVPVNEELGVAASTLRYQKSA